MSKNYLKNMIRLIIYFLFITFAGMFIVRRLDGPACEDNVPLFSPVFACEPVAIRADFPPGRAVDK